MTFLTANLAQRVPFAALMVFGSFLSIAAGQQSQEEQQAFAIAQRLANAQENWGSATMNSPGASITLRETGRQEAGGSTAVTYRIIANGLPMDKIYTLMEVSFDLKPLPQLEGITLGDSGVAICAGKENTCGDSRKPNDPIDLIVLAAKGEPKRFALISQDGEIKAFASVVPFPSRASNRSCSIESLLLMQNGETVLLHGTGFPPRVEVRFDTSSEGESHSGNLKADDTGNVWTVTLPFVKGKARGTTKASFKSASCSPSLTYQWGAGSYKMQ